MKISKQISCAFLHFIFPKKSEEKNTLIFFFPVFLVRLSFLFSFFFLSLKNIEVE